MEGTDSPDHNQTARKQAAPTEGDHGAEQNNDHSSRNMHKKKPNQWRTPKTNATAGRHHQTDSRKRKRKLQTSPVEKSEQKKDR